MASSFAVKMGKAVLLGYAESLGSGLAESVFKLLEQREKQARKDIGNNCQAPKKCKFSPEDIERFELTQTVELLARSAPMSADSPDQWAIGIVAHALALRTELRRVLDARRPNAVDPSAAS